MTQAVMSEADLRAYLGGISPSTLSRWIQAGRVPPSLPGTRGKWLRAQVDRYLDAWARGALCDNRKSGQDPLDEETLIEQARTHANHHALR